MITQQELKEVLHYNPDTGIFTWLKTVNSRAVKGSIAGWSNNNFHAQIQYNKIKYQVHNLAWLYMTGKWPTDQIDHINRIKNDNRWCNLREATKSQNQANKLVQKNNKSGFKGVDYIEGKYRATIRINKEKIYLGRFNTAEEAARAYDLKAKELFGDFAVLNFK